MLSTTPTPETSEKKKRGFRVPHVWTIILFCLILSGIMTYIVPAGEYARVEVAGRKVIDPASFHYIEQSPVTPFKWFVSIIEGLTASMAIMSMIWFTISATEVYTQTGTLRKMIAWLLKVCKNNYILVMVAIMSFFAVRGAMGAFELHIPFVPMTIALALACGCDVMTGLALAIIPTFASFAIGPINPYTVAVAQGIAGLPVYSAMGFRVVIWLAICITAMWYVIRYAAKVKADPSKSVSGFINPSPSAETFDIEEMKKETMTGRQKILTVMLLVTIALQIVGPMQWKWGFAEIGAMWLISGILAGVVAGFDNYKICHIMADASAAIFAGVICIGLARSVSVVLAKGQILDTVIYALSIPLQKIPSAFSALGMLVIQSIINFFIPSGSGQAAVTMPIMAPLADVIGVTRQTAVLAFQLGDGLTNLIIPTMGALVVYIGVAKIEFSTFFKWVLPLYGMLMAIGSAGLIIATVIKLGPF
ncbi:AbgT family transporter [Synergistaceae bacterium OttesenSCG-928-D05]|nr:AbgT family transporter [Synergistaceae bacterium OttesenSCG-928-D05]